MSLIFPLDLGTHRLLTAERPLPAPELQPEEPEALQRVMVEVEPDDLAGEEFSGYAVGVYDSPYSPRATLGRLASADRNVAVGER